MRRRSSSRSACEHWLLLSPPALLGCTYLIILATVCSLGLFVEAARRMPKQFRLTWSGLGGLSTRSWLEAEVVARGTVLRCYLVEESGSRKKKLGDANRRRLREGSLGSVNDDEGCRQANIGERAVCCQHRRDGCRRKLSRTPDKCIACYDCAASLWLKMCFSTCPSLAR